MKTESFLTGCRRPTTPKNIAKFAVNVCQTQEHGFLNAMHMRDGQIVYAQLCAALAALVLANLFSRLFCHP